MATLIVGANQPYTSIKAAVAAAKAGDTVLIQTGTYTNDFPATINGLTIKGVGGPVKLVATIPPPNQKGYLDVSGNTTLINLDISGVKVLDASGGNGAGVRYEGGNLTIRNCAIHGNQNGLLANADPAGTITIDSSEFYGNGEASTSAKGYGNTHNIYVGDVKQFTLTNSYVHDAAVGHEVKSRAENSVITNNRIFDNAGSSSYSIDLPNGGNATIANNVIQQGANGQNPIIVAYGEEGGLHAGASVSFTGNTVVNDRSSATLFWNKPSTPVSTSGNSLYNLTQSQLGLGDARGFAYATKRPVLSTASPVQAPQDLLTVAVTADTVGGKVGFIAAVDGKVLGAPQYVSAKSGAAPQVAAFVGAWGSGAHRITIAEINPQSEGFASHALQIQAVVFDGWSILTKPASVGTFASEVLNTAQPGAGTVTRAPAGSRAGRPSTMPWLPARARCRHPSRSSTEARQAPPFIQAS